jgi:hypothetical protein
MRRLLFALPLLAALLACSGVPGLLARLPAVDYPGASELALDDDDRAEALAQMFSSALLGFEHETTFATTEDSGDDVQEYFDETLGDGDWEMLYDDWLETDEDRSLSVWGRDGRYGLVVVVDGDLDPDDLDYYEDELSIDGLERGQTLIVTHTWDISQVATRGSSPPAEWDDESFDDLGVTLYLPGEWSPDERDRDTVRLGGWTNPFLYRVDGDDFGPYSFDFDEDASAPDLVESFLDEADFDAVGEVESITTAAGRGSRVYFEVGRDRYGYIGVLKVEDEALVLLSADIYLDEEDALPYEAATLDAVFASIRLED